MEEIENLIMVYVLVKPRSTAEFIYRIWPKSKIFREYERPEITMIEQIVKDVQDWRQAQTVKQAELNI